MGLADEASSISTQVTVTECDLSSVFGPEAVDALRRWYPSWVEDQWRRAPVALRERVPDFASAFVETARLNEMGSIYGAASSLIRLGHFKDNGQDEDLSYAISFAFAALGWQTMLYEPAFGTAPPDQLAIADILEGFAGCSYMSLRQSVARAKCPPTELLLGFGLMLPRANICISDDAEDGQAFEKVSIVRPEELNFFLLSSLAKVRIQWIDALAPHLEFDKATNTLFLFRHPSFCRANVLEDTTGQSPIYVCSSTTDATTQWASRSEVTQMLKEIMLSYRLLFGQVPKARRVFNQMQNSKGSPLQPCDDWLVHLCTSKSATLPASCVERDFYRLSRDFPILRSRIAVLQQHMVRCKPKDWLEIWRDSRDSAQWLAFWAVISLGMAGLCLSILQVALQAAQLART